MITTEEFLNGPGKYYALTPSNTLSSIETLAWGAAAELAAFAENAFAPENLHRDAHDTYLILWGLEAYFKDIGHLPSQSHGLVMLLIERASWGLTPHGNDKNRQS